MKMIMKDKIFMTRNITKRPVTISPNCKFCPAVFKERMKKEISSRIDMFFNDVSNKQARTSEEWMKEYMSWSFINTLE